MANITKVHAREIFDSRGNPTVEVEVTTSKGKALKTQKPPIHYFIVSCKGDSFRGEGWFDLLLNNDFK